MDVSEPQDEDHANEEEQHHDEHTETFFAQIMKRRSSYAFTGETPNFDAPVPMNIHYAAYQEHGTPTTPFLGICMDEGATESICGKPQYEAYLRTVHLPETLRALQPSDAPLRFGGKGENQLVLPSLGIAVIRFPVLGYGYFEYLSRIFDAHHYQESAKKIMEGLSQTN